MRIIRGNEPIAVEHPVFMLFGQPGICKSSLGYSAHDPLTLDFDHGAHRAANRRDTLVIDTWADAAELTDQAAALVPYSTIVVDTVGRCLDLMSTDIIASNPKLGRNGNLSLKGYGELKARFRLWVAQLRTYGKDVVLLAHDKEANDGDVTVIRPDITGGSYAEVMKIADFVGYVSMNGKNRVLDFNPTDRWVGKNPAGWAPLILPPVAKASDVLAELMAKGRAALGAISDVSAKAANEVDEWRVIVSAFTEVSECNRALAPINAIKAPIVQAAVKKILMGRITALGFVYDPSLKAFVVATQTAGTAA